MEADDEVKGTKNSYDFGARMLDPRVGRWLSGDPHEHKYSSISTYVFVVNSPIIAIDPDGRDVIILGEKEFKKSVRSHIKILKKSKVFRKTWRALKRDHGLEVKIVADDILAAYGATGLIIPKHAHWVEPLKKPVDPFTGKQSDEVVGEGFLREIEARAVTLKLNSTDGRTIRDDFGMTLVLGEEIYHTAQYQYSIPDLETANKVESIRENIQDPRVTNIETEARHLLAISLIEMGSEDNSYVDKDYFLLQAVNLFKNSSSTIFDSDGMLRKIDLSGESGEGYKRNLMDMYELGYAGADGLTSPDKADKSIKKDENPGLLNKVIEEMNPNVKAPK